MSLISLVGCVNHTGSHTLDLLPQQIVDLKVLEWRHERKVMSTPLEAPGDKDAVAPAKSQAQPPQRILVVDGDTDTRQLYSEVLIGSGYQVDTAEDGEAGWKVLHAVRYDPDSYNLLITDNNLPKLSGVELVRKLRSARMALPVILASIAVPINTEELQLAAILPKPFYPDQLVQTVGAVLHTANRSIAGDYGCDANKVLAGFILKGDCLHR